MEFGILGPLEVSGEDGPIRLGGRRQRTVLAVLLLNANRVTSIDHLIDLVWGEDPPATARRSSQVYVSRLRQLLGAERIRPIVPGYELRLDDGELDADRFSREVDAARSMSATDPERALQSYDEALALWRGAALADLVDDSRLAARARSLDEARLTAVEERFDVALALGHLDRAIGELEASVGEYPYRERLWAQLMTALYLAGRQADALRAYSRARERLVEDLGIEPSADLRDLETRILNQDPNLRLVSETRAPPRVPVRRNPYKGLRAFGEGDASDFFGRDRLVETVLERVEQGNRVVAVIGPSGCGKSSLLSAGVLPTLRRRLEEHRDAATILRMEPGEHPFESLELAIVSAGCEPEGNLLDTLESGPEGFVDVLCATVPGRTFLFIDQVEELFMVDDPAVRNRFTAGLTSAALSESCDLTMVVALRADFYDRPLNYQPLAEPFVRGMISVTPLSEEELRAVIVEPAARVGVVVEPALVTRLVAILLGEPAALPQLQFVLMRLFDTRTGDRITVDDYEREGGITGILARRAEAAYLSLSRAERDIARQVFFRLVAYRATGAATRRQAPLDEVDALGPEVQQILDRFGGDRLIGFDRDPLTRRPTVALVHDALISEWTRLHSWIALAQADLVLRDALDFEIATWIDSGRDRDFLLTGSRLDQYEEWRRRAQLALTAGEEEFLRASLDRREEERAAETRRAEREHALEESAHRRAIALSVVMSIAALVAALLAFVAIAQGNTAARNAEDAERSATVAQQERSDAQTSQARAVAAALRTASTASIETDPERSVLLALHAIAVLDAERQPVDAYTIGAMLAATEAAGARYAAEGGTVAVVDGPDGLIATYDRALGDLVDRALGVVDRALSAAECSEFFAGQECSAFPDTLSAETRATPVGRTPDDPQRPLAGTSVRVLSPWSESEAVAFSGELSRFTSQTGIKVVLSSPSLVTDGATPSFDVVGISRPAWLELDAADVFVPVGGYLDAETLQGEQDPYLLSLMSVDGELRGVPVAINPKSLIWYPVEAFDAAGYTVPSDWSELSSLSAQMIADGRTPWCFAEGSPADDGWPATDFVEDLVLHGLGPEAYDQWTARAMPFGSDGIRRAFARFAEVAFTDGSLYGGMQHALVTSAAEGLEPMKDEPPGCWLYHQGGSVVAALPNSALSTGSIGFFTTPAIDARFADTMLGSAVYAAAVTDRPEVRELIRFLASPDFGLTFARSPEVPFVAANRNFDTSRYGSDVKRELAAAVHESLVAGGFRFDGSVLMGMESEFRRAMITYLVRGSEFVDATLNHLDIVGTGADGSLVGGE